MYGWAKNELDWTCPASFFLSPTSTVAVLIFEEYVPDMDNNGWEKEVQLD